MVGMVNRVSYLLLKQMVSQNEEKKEKWEGGGKERICQIRHEYKSHTSLRKVTCVLSAISVMSELSQGERSVSIQTIKGVIKKW